jgi:16S rRNA (cytosine1407-C5)-methyltransferase
VITPSFEEALRGWFGEEQTRALISGLTAPRKLTFRRNPLKISTADFKAMCEQFQFAFEPLPGFEDVFVVDAAEAAEVTHNPAAAEGKIYIQNPSSMLAALLLDPKPEEEVLDLTAAPGSKTQLLSVLMQNTGRIAAVELQRDRFYRMKANLERCGVANAACYHKDGSIVGRQRPEAFDRVLLDAPCSSESFIGTSETVAAETWSLRKVHQTVSRQKMLLNSAVAALKPGGRLVYATCTINPLENEEMVAYALKKHGEILSLEKNNALEKFQTPVYSTRFQPLAPEALRIMPGPVWDGFFIAVFRKAV